MRGEELRCSGDVLGSDLLVLFQPREDLVLLLRDVELVESADDLDVLTRVIRHYAAQLSQDRGLRQQILGHQ